MVFVFTLEFDFRRNAAMLEIYYEQLNFELLEEYEAYGVSCNEFCLIGVLQPFHFASFSLKNRLFC